MNTKEILKKFWFVILIGVLFLGLILAYGIDSIKNQEVVKEPKEIDGQYIVYSINGENYTADELYSELKDVYGLQTIYQMYDRLVSDKAINTTQEMKDIASSNAQYLLSYYGKEELDAQMQSIGFAGSDEAYDYYLYIQKAQQLRINYLKEHSEEYVIPFVEKNAPKVISHILVKVADVEEVTNEDGTKTLVAHPTFEEEEKLNDVLKALETEDFATVAKQYSEDGSAQDGGILGYFDNNNTTYVDTFKETAKTVSEGEMSDVFVSEYGYHIIYCNTENLDELYVYTDFLNAMFEAYPNLYNLPLVEKAKELGIEFTDVELYNTLVEAMGVESEDVQ